MAEHTPDADAALSLSHNPADALHSISEWVHLMHNSVDGLYFLTELKPSTVAPHLVRLLWLVKMAGEYFMDRRANTYGVLTHLQADPTADYVDRFDSVLSQASLAMDTMVAHAINFMDGADDQDSPLNVPSILLTFEVLLDELNRCFEELRTLLAEMHSALPAVDDAPGDADADG